MILRNNAFDFCPHIHIDTLNSRFLLSEGLKPSYVTQLATLMCDTFIYEAFLGDKFQNENS